MTAASAGAVDAALTNLEALHDKRQSRILLAAAAWTTTCGSSGW